MLHRSTFVLCLLSITATCALAATDASAAKERQIGQYSGFEGNEAALGRAVAQAIESASPDGSARHDFTGREELLGRSVATVIKTLNHNRIYQHETNDALVKMTLDHIQAAKHTGTLAAILAQDVHSTRQQLERVRELIERTGDKDLALVGVFEQTACFFQLVEQTQRAPGRVTYRSPFGVVLAQTRRMGIHDLTEKEIHELWTVPRMREYSKILGVDLEVTPWQDDGTITVSVDL